MRTFTLAKAMAPANSDYDYKHMAEDEHYNKTHSAVNPPFCIGSHNLMRDYAELLKQKGAKVS